MADIATEIWLEAVPGDYPGTAEERATIDAHLKRRLRGIEDSGIRNHAEQIVRQRRAAAIRGEDETSEY